MDHGSRSDLRPGEQLLSFPLPLSVWPRRDFHVLGRVRRSLQLNDSLFSLHGSLLSADPQALTRLAGWLGLESGQPVSQAELVRALVIHELMHLLISELRSRNQLDLKLLTDDLDRQGQLDRLLIEFRELFPAGSGGEGHLPQPELLEELLLVYLHNRNPAFSSVRPLLADEALQANPSYQRLDRLFGSVYTGTDDTGADAQLLAALGQLLAPQLSGPADPEAQLAYLQRQLAGFSLVHEEASRLLQLAADVLAEQREPGSASGPGPGSVTAPAERGELLPLAAAPGRVPEASWMQDTVIIAKNCLVWLSQLSSRHERAISRLDQIPDSELRRIADSGVNALWLIGIWQRSAASRRIKQLRGQPDAAASAYSIHDYVIATELGGEQALEQLQRQAHAHGLKLVADMVPNHTALDSRWVLEHPERFMQLDESPYAGYAFTGPELSTDPRVSVMLEDHYWDGSDAAVVFRRADRFTGDSTFIYHGNDGTGLPWNDTAQLDYRNPETREAVLQQMVAVARRFPVIRFDAAMTLVSRHIQRLWYPPPGSGGAIASRALHGSTGTADLERQLAGEFWSTAVIRLQQEAPDTLLIAEAFWMLEEYFVRNLGLHRVYNSAFMHMIRDHANREFRQLLGTALATDPELPGRFVNFLSNPDEESAAGQFGTGDRYFVACTLLVTLPGLPLIGHGQFEGLTEKYGMEFTGPRTAEQPDPEVIARHEREIRPLLQRRQLFAGSAGFVLFSFQATSGQADDVLAFSKLADSGTAVVLVNNSPTPVSGRLAGSVTDGQPGGVSLATALALDRQEATHVSWRLLADGLEYQLPLEQFRAGGLEFTLAGYDRRVLLDFRLHEANSELRFDLLQAGAGHQDVREAAARAAWWPFGDWLLELPGTVDQHAPLPPGSELAPETMAKLRDRAGRLARLRASLPLAQAWEALTRGQRLWLLLQGLDAQQLTDRLAPELPGWFSELPWRPEPDWWESRELGSWLGVHEADGRIWFAGERFEQLAAAYALRGALRAGEEAGAELWLALRAGRDYSGWGFSELLRLLGVHSDG